MIRNDFPFHVTLLDRYEDEEHYAELYHVGVVRLCGVNLFEHRMNFNYFGEEEMIDETMIAFAERLASLLAV